MVVNLILFAALEATLGFMYYRLSRKILHLEENILCGLVTLYTNFTAQVNTEHLELNNHISNVKVNLDRSISGAVKSIESVQLAVAALPRKDDQV